MGMRLWPKIRHAQVLMNFKMHAIIRTPPPTSLALALSGIFCNVKALKKASISRYFFGTLMNTVTVKDESDLQVPSITSLCTPLSFHLHKIKTCMCTY